MLRTRVLAAVVLSTFAAAMVGCDDDDELTDIDDDGFYTAALTPGAEIPAPVGNPTATAQASFDLDDGELTVTIVVTGTLTSGVTGAHIHGPATGTTTGDIVLDFSSAMTSVINAGARSGTIVSAEYDLEEIAPSASGELRIDPHVLIDMLNNGQAYVNVHTVTNATGEIRGQIVRR
jgi:hypothetical protein